MRVPIISITAIAAICHEANAAYCRSIGDTSQPSWDDAPEWQKASALAGVTGIINGTITTPEQSHESWMKQKLDDGWKYGPVKNPETKEHPCMVPYAELPPEQQVKDAIFHGTVKSLTTAASGDRFSENGQFHWADGLYFRRMESGCVRIQQRSGTMHEAVDREHHIPRNEWDSIKREMGE